MFAAIEFVLTLEYRNLKSQTRAELLNNSRAHKYNDPAFVEIIFDNSDGKLPVSLIVLSFQY